MFHLRCTLSHTVPSRITACLYRIEFLWPLATGQWDNFLHFHAIRCYLGGRKRARMILEDSSVCLFFSKSDLWIPINSLIGILSIWLPLSLWKAKRSQGQLLEEPKIEVQRTKLSFFSEMVPLYCLLSQVCLEGDSSRKGRGPFFQLLSWNDKEKRISLLLLGLFIKLSSKNEL